MFRDGIFESFGDFLDSIKESTGNLNEGAYVCTQCGSKRTSEVGDEWKCLDCRTVGKISAGDSLDIPMDESKLKEDTRKEAEQTMEPQEEQPKEDAERLTMEDWSEEDKEGEPKRKDDVEYDTKLREPEEKEFSQEVKYESKKDPLHLCNFCFKTFRSKESACTFCESKETENIVKEEASSLTATIPEESKVNETVQELVGETPGIDRHQQDVLNWAIEKGVIPNEWPSDEVMVDALSASDAATVRDAEDEELENLVGEGPEDVSGLDLGETQAAYLKYILLPKATMAWRQQEELPAESEVDEDVVSREDIEKALISAREEYKKYPESKVWPLLIRQLEGEQIDWSEEYKESKLKEQEENGYTTVAKGIEDRQTADEVSRDKGGQVITDEEDPNKFAVIVKKEW